MGLFNFINKNSKTPVDRYFEYLDGLFRKEPEFYQNESLRSGLAGVTSIVYRDVPEKGFTTALTYGLSLVDHPLWKFGRPELCISVKSSNIEWGYVLGFLANKLRGDCPFSYGQAINFGEQISEDSKMDAFLVFAPSILEKEDYSNIEIGTDYQVNLVGVYPMYSDEIEVYNELGLEAFWHHPNFDLYDVGRKKITL